MLHYFDECEKFKEQRKILTNELRQINHQITNQIAITLQLLLTGYPIQSIEQRTKIMKQTVVYVLTTKFKTLTFVCEY